MSEILADSRSIWALVLVVVLPVVIIGAGELEERLRQLDSALTPVVSILRAWTVPIFAAWALALGLFELGSENLIIRILGTGLLLSLSVAGLGVMRIVVTWLRQRGESDERRGVPQILLALPRVAVIIATGWFLIDGVWGVDLSAALTALGVTSLVISLALQDTLSGLASGLLLLGDAPFQPGDWIRTGDLEGRVMDVNWRSSRIEDRNGDLHVVPNAQLANATVVNYDRPTQLHRVVVSLQVAYVNPPTLAKEMLLDAARSTPGVLEEPAPDVRVVQIDDPLMGYEVHMWVEDYQNAPKVASDFGYLVWYQSHRHNVPLPSPAQDLYLYDGVEAGASGMPDKAEVRRQLLTSPLLDQLSEADIDQLVGGATPVRYREGEMLLETGLSSRDLYVLWVGTARIVADGPAGQVFDVAELVPGDVFGLLGKPEGRQQGPRVMAVTDCEVVIISQAVAQAVTSHNPALAAVLNRVRDTRRRRLNRMLESATTYLEPTADEDASASKTDGGEQ